MKNTIFECHQRNKNGLLEVKYKADTQNQAIQWLKNNGGGVYKNILHQFQMSVS